MLGKKLGIDLGSGSIRVAVRGEPGALVEPSVVGRRERGGFAGMGLAAVEVAASDPGYELVRPLEGGVLADPGALAALLQYVVNRVAGRQRIFRPDMVVALSPAIDDAGRHHVLEVCARLGARTSYLIETPLAAAMGAGLSLSTGNGHLIVDIGSGTVDIAAVAHEGTIAGHSLGPAGDALRRAVAARIQEQHEIQIDDLAAETVVASLACAGPHEERRMTVGGIGGQGFAEVSVASTDLAGVVAEHVRRVAQGVESILAETPASLRGDIATEGITLCGGGARLQGVDRALAAATGRRVRVANEPQRCVVNGTALALENLDVLRRSFMYIR